MCKKKVTLGNFWLSSRPSCCPRESVLWVSRKQISNVSKTNLNPNTFNEVELRLTSLLLRCTQ